MKVMDAIQDLVKQGLDHPPGQLQGLLIGLGRSVELYDVLWIKGALLACLRLCVCILLSLWES